MGNAFVSSIGARRLLMQAAITLQAAVGAIWLPSVANAKLPGVIHCYNDICHRVRTVEETAARMGMVEPVVASFYDAPEKDRFNPSFETSSGTLFDPDADDNAASPIHPDGTILLLWSPLTRGAAIVRINNAGPYYPGRTLDVSRGVADRLGFSRGGVMQLLSVVISAPSEPEAHYSRGRVYPKVSGYLGKFENIALASFAAPAARRGLFQGNARLPLQARGTSEQILLHATEEHFRLSELARLFSAVPADMISPIDSEATPGELSASEAGLAASPTPERTRSMFHDADQAVSFAPTIDLQLEQHSFLAALGVPYERHDVDMK